MTTADWWIDFSPRFPPSPRGFSVTPSSFRQPGLIADLSSIGWSRGRGERKKLVLLDGLAAGAKKGFGAEDRLRVSRAVPVHTPRRVMASTQPHLGFVFVRPIPYTAQQVRKRSNQKVHRGIAAAWGNTRAFQFLSKNLVGLLATQTVHQRGMTPKRVGHD